MKQESETTRSPGYTIRGATAGDQATIVRIVRAAGINPFSLHWPRFLIAEEQRRIVGIAQIKTHGDGSRELASLAVVPDWQGKGVGSALVREWLSREPGPLYLTCQERLHGYYERFGFRRAGTPEMPPYFRRLMRLANVLAPLLTLLGGGSGPIVMVREPGSPASWLERNDQPAPLQPNCHAA